MGEAFIVRRGGGVDASDATALAADILSGKNAYIDDSGDPVTGTMPNNGAVAISLGINGNYVIPAGYHNGSGKVTQNITTKTAATFTPSTADQTITSGQYLSGNQTIKGDANLISANIKSGITIFGVSGNPNVVDTSDATALAANILSGIVAYVKGAKIVGTIASKAAETITPGTSDKTIAASQYLSGIQTIKGDANLISANIKAGITLFGVSGNSNVVDTSDATALAANILSGVVAYVKGAKITGSISSKAAATFTPSTADQIIASGQYLSGNQTIKGDANLISANIKSGITIFGVSGNSNVVDTSDATALAANILSGVVAYVKGAKITGNIPSKAAATITPGTSNQTIGAGQYLSGIQTISGDANLIADNILSGKSIFGVSGNVKPKEIYQGTKTVTVDGTGVFFRIGPISQQSNTGILIIGYFKNRANQRFVLGIHNIFKESDFNYKPHGFDYMPLGYLVTTNGTTVVCTASSGANFQFGTSSNSAYMAAGDEYIYTAIIL